MTGVHPPSPHPKSPIWQKTEIGFESTWSVTSWLTNDLLNMEMSSTKGLILDYLDTRGLDRKLSANSIFKKLKTCSVFLSSCSYTSENLRKREMLWEQVPTGECFHRFFCIIYTADIHNFSSSETNARKRNPFYQLPPLIVGH